MSDPTRGSGEMEHENEEQVAHVDEPASSLEQATASAASATSVGAFGDPCCEHGTAMDVHCCNCHAGFLFDWDACTCDDTPVTHALELKFGRALTEDEWREIADAAERLPYVQVLEAHATPHRCFGGDCSVCATRRAMADHSSSPADPTRGGGEFRALVEYGEAGSVAAYVERLQAAHDALLVALREAERLIVAAWHVDTGAAPDHPYVVLRHIRAALASADRREQNKDKTDQARAGSPDVHPPTAVPQRPEESHS